MTAEIGANLARLEAAIAAAGRRLTPSLLEQTVAALEQARAGARDMETSGKRELAGRVRHLRAVLRRAESVQNEVAAIESSWARELFTALGAEPAGSYAPDGTATLPTPRHRLELEA